MEQTLHVSRVAILQMVPGELLLLLLISRKPSSVPLEKMDSMTCPAEVPLSQGSTLKISRYSPTQS